VRFSKYINNIRDSAGRTKEQLIAIYRYWLKKGSDQTTEAMLKSNTVIPYPYPYPTTNQPLSITNQICNE
jgi:hypothetical protein